MSDSPAYILTLEKYQRIAEIPASRGNIDHYQDEIEATFRRKQILIDEGYSQEDMDRVVEEFENDMRGAWEDVLSDIRNILYESLTCEICGEDPTASSSNHVKPASITSTLEEISEKDSDTVDMTKPVKEFVEEWAPDLYSFEKEYREQVLSVACNAQAPSSTASSSDN
jgi:hypothetical protein